jgi:hypothetical protein
MRSTRLHDSARDHDAGSHVLPQSNQQLAGERDNGRLLGSRAALCHPRDEPAAERGVRLMSQPKSGELDERGEQSRITRFAHPLVVTDIATSPMERREPRIGCKRSTIVECAG